MAVTDEEEERAVCLVLADLKATLGPGYESMVRDITGRLREFIDDRALGDVRFGYYLPVGGNQACATASKGGSRRLPVVLAALVLASSGTRDQTAHYLGEKLWTVMPAAFVVKQPTPSRHGLDFLPGRSEWDRKISTPRNVRRCRRRNGRAAGQQ